MLVLSARGLATIVCMLAAAVALVLFTVSLHAGHWEGEAAATSPVLSTRSVVS